MNMFYVSFMLTTKQKLTVDTQKIKRKESKHNTTKKSSYLREKEKNKGIIKETEKH